MLIVFIFTKDHGHVKPASILRRKEIHFFLSYSNSELTICAFPASPESCYLPYPASPSCFGEEDEDRWRTRPMGVGWWDVGTVFILISLLSSLFSLLSFPRSYLLFPLFSVLCSLFSFLFPLPLSLPLPSYPLLDSLTCDM